MKKTVVLSTNDNPDYCKYLPYTIEAWNKLGWDTLTFYMGSNADEVKKTIPDLNDKNKFSEIFGKPEWCIEATAVQVARLFGGHLLTGLIMTGDVDLIPLANYWNPTLDHITVYGFDLTGRSQYPICYIAMTADKWQRMIPEVSLSELLEKYPNAKSDDFYKWWGVDQEIITQRINERKSDGELVLIDRGFTNGLAKGRIDRYDWEGTINNSDRKIDAHMLRPFNLEQTERVMKLIQP